MEIKLEIKIKLYWSTSNIFESPKTLSQNLTSSTPEMFLGEGVLNIYVKVTREHPCRRVISIKLLHKLKSHFDMGVLL